MKNPGKRVFVERDGYRRRRLLDCLRVLPMLGAFLWALPLLWSSDPQAGVSTADAILYIFAVWCCLVGLGALLSYKVGALQDSDRDSLE